MIVTVMILIPIIAGLLCLDPLGSKNLFRIATIGALASAAVAVYCCLPPLKGEMDTWIWYVMSSPLSS